MNLLEFIQSDKTPVRLANAIQSAFTREQLQTTELNDVDPEHLATLKGIGKKTVAEFTETRRRVNAGRKSLYETPEQMQHVIDDYFANERIPTVCGLALALGMNSRQTLLNYQGKAKFLDTITRAKLRIEAYNERQLFREKGSTAGVQFNLENNFDWKNTRHNIVDIPHPMIGLDPKGTEQYDRDIENTGE